MSNSERLALVREKLTAAQVALATLQRYLAELPSPSADASLTQRVADRMASAYLDELADAFLDLEAATGAVSTPAALFNA
jgi:hypothetical protein